MGTHSIGPIQEERLKEEVERLKEVLHKVKLENQQKEIQLEENINDFEIKVSNSLIPSFQLTGSNTTRKRCVVNNRNDLLQLSFTLKISIFSETCI